MVEQFKRKIMQEEIERTLWLSQKQKAIDRLQDMRFPDHFCLITTEPGEHTIDSIISTGCTPWMIAAGAATVDMVLNPKDTKDN
jgi:hypothetical protein